MSYYKSREELFSYFNKHSAEKKDELDRHKTRSPLLKSYIIETSSVNHKKNFFDEINNHYNLSELKGEIIEIDDDLEDDKPAAWIESYNSRYFIFYSTRTTEIIENKLMKVIQNSPLLDTLWLADSFYYNFYNYIKNNFNDYRYVKLKMKYDSELKTNINKNFISEDKPKELIEDLKNIETHKDFNLSESINNVNKILPELRKMKYWPAANSISMLRIPAKSGGGIDLYNNGKITNRSRSFIDLHHNIKFLLDNYSYLNKLLEEKTWLKQEKHNFQSSGYTIKGSPVIIEFEESLDLTVFKNFIYKIFQQRNKNFRLWGEPLKISEKKYHIYGLDLHLWKEVFLEITPDLFVLILPEGVCGNTINRFITNIQTFLEPNFKVYIGDESYDKFLEKSFLEGGLKS
ncbi:hypothetical protein C7957_14020 [Halanaerobium saccharolyticum]|jgi:hypothetical protein|uniref:Uncharacterized protein n=1 Tax=Halanaerobium saccharolyticum TaxID=43595 RepID=A0A4R6RGS2_9FIRM|nr:hypothetical protein [Halanaerobium saccharolyticum]TDP85651.1 hypothetical protein C7957_14020 [Halanaerobium saccharolyticum]